MFSQVAVYIAAERGYFAEHCSAAIMLQTRETRVNSPAEIAAWAGARHIRGVYLPQHLGHNVVHHLWEDPATFFAFIGLPIGLWAGFRIGRPLHEIFAPFTDVTVSYPGSVRPHVVGWITAYVLFVFVFGVYFYFLAINRGDPKNAFEPMSL